jgi:hypothetical protein
MPKTMTVDGFTFESSHDEDNFDAQWLLTSHRPKGRLYVVQVLSGEVYGGRTTYAVGYVTRSRTHVALQDNCPSLQDALSAVVRHVRS